MRELERNREAHRRHARASLGQNPRSPRYLAADAQNLSVDVDLWGLPADLDLSGGVQDNQGRFLFLAGFDEV